MFKGVEIIHTYTRQQAIEDGVLVDVSEMYPDLVSESGIKWPVAMTMTAWGEFVKVHPAAERLCQDENGRMWDILWMLFVAIKRGEITGSEGLFSFYAVGSRNRKTMLQQLKAVVGPDDNGDPVFTLMLPNED